MRQEFRDPIPSSQYSRIPPLRSLNDFILDATWNVPKFSDSPRLENRIYNNLIYYQTNYFVLGIAILLIFGIIYAADFLIGLVVVIILCFAFGIIIKLSKTRVRPTNGSSSETKNGHSVIILVLFIGAIYMIMRFLFSILIFALSIGLPILAVIIHATLRKRNFANKVFNKLDRIQLQATLMGMLLESLGMRDLSLMQK